MWRTVTVTTVTVTTVTVTTVTLLVWIAFSLAVVPRVIEQAYRNESHPLINSMITRRDRPVEDYLSEWRGDAMEVGFALLVAVPLLAAAIPRIVVLSRAREFHQMPAVRVIVACLTISVVFLGSAFEMVVSREHWPFSPYKMYSSLSTERSATTVHVYLVGSDGEEFLAQNSFPPFDRSRLANSLIGHESRGTIGEAGQRLLELYQQQDDARPIQGLRIYRCRWELDRWARNSDHPERTLLCECLQNKAS